MISSTNTATPFFYFLLHGSEILRMYFVSSIITVYALVLYEVFPQYLFNLDKSIYYFVLPSIVSLVVCIIIPKILSNGKTNNQMGEPNTLLDSDLSAISYISNEADAQVQTIFNSPSDNGEIQSPTLDDTVIQQLVDKVMASSSNQSTKIKNDLDEVKKNIEELSTMFETSCLDSKSFQAEISNPLNFMRKYFDTVDIQQLSDSSSTLPLIEKTSLPSESSETFKVSEFDEIKGSNGKAKINNIIAENMFSNIMNNNITLGKLMKIISIVEETVQTSGPNSMNLLINQCKIAGLESNIENIVYEVIDMLNISNVPVNDTLIRLYKFAQAVGINDKDADDHYAKLIIDEQKKHATFSPQSFSTPGSKINVQTQGDEIATIKL